MNNKQWSEKYRPKSFDEVKGQILAVEKLKFFLKYFGTGKKAIVLHGPPGTGKTTLAHVAGIETGSEVFELNASNLRDKNKLNEILRPALEQRSLMKKGKIILVDEVDGISAVDRGGLTELLSLINSAKYPIIITANDVWKSKLSTLRKKVEIVPVREIDYNIIKDIMIQTLRKENKFIENDILSKIAINAKGDLRAAMNDLQAACEMKNPAEILAEERNKESDIFNALRTVFKEKPKNEILRVYDSVKMPIDEIVLWVEENIPEEYRAEALENAYDKLSKVDVFKGRIYKQQYWRFLVYENILLSYGICAAKRGVQTNYTNYKKPTRILKIWINNQRNAKKKTIAEKYSKLTHIGLKRAMNEFATIKQILKDIDVRDELKLTDDEREYLDKPVLVQY